MIKTIDATIGTAEINVIDALVEMGACPSKAQAKRLLGQGAIKINGDKVKSQTVTISNESVLQCGKHFWRKLILPTSKMTLDVRHFTNREDEENWLRDSNLTEEVIQQYLSEDWD